MLKQKPLPTYTLADLPDDYDPTNHKVDLTECKGLAFRFFDDGYACCLAYPMTSFLFSNDVVFQCQQTGEKVTAKEIRTKRD